MTAARQRAVLLGAEDVDGLVDHVGALVVVTLVRLARQRGLPKQSAREGSLALVRELVLVFVHGGRLTQAGSCEL